VDVRVITAMPHRGDPTFATLLGTARVITDFGKAAYVQWSVSLLLVIAAVGQALVPAPRRRQAVTLAFHIAYVLLAVAVPVAVGEGLKGLFGRARPFVGGHADVFHFVPWTWHEPYFSLPSAHAISAVALAAAVSMVWPRTRFVMVAYAVLIVVSRVVLLDHHPSDVTAGGLLGILGALLVRQVFASWGVGFAIDPDGRVRPAR
jgi:undecaprenyl-diphosphatase